MPSASPLADLSRHLAVLGDLHRSCVDRSALLISGLLKPRAEANADPRLPDVTEGGLYHPPPCYTPTRSECSVDYLTMGFPVEHIDRVRTLLEAPLLIREWSEEGAPRICSCASAERLPDGAVVAWGHPTCPEMAFFQLSGDVLFRRYSLQQVQALIQAVLRLGGWATRLDLALDVRGEFPLVDVVARAVKDRQLCRLRSSDCTVDLVNGVLKNVYLGSVHSDKYIRVYRKDVESGEMLDDGRQWCRWELQSRHDIAQQIAEAIAETPDDELPALILARVFGPVEFREAPRGVSRSLARRPLLPWWQALTATVCPVNVAERRKPSSLAGKLEHLGKTMTREIKKLAAIAKVPPRVVMRYLEARCPPPERIGKLTLAHEEWAALAPELLRPFMARAPVDPPLPARVVVQRPASLRASPWLR